MRRRWLVLTVLILALMAGVLGHRGHSIGQEADQAEATPAPASLLQNRPAQERVAIERSYRNCLGQAVLDGRTVAQAAPDCERRLAQVLPR